MRWWKSVNIAKQFKDEQHSLKSFPLWYTRDGQRLTCERDNDIIIDCEDDMLEEDCCNTGCITEWRRIHHGTVIDSKYSFDLRLTCELVANEVLPSDVVWDKMYPVLETNSKCNSINLSPWYKIIGPLLTGKRPSDNVVVGESDMFDYDCWSTDKAIKIITSSLGYCA